MIASRESVSTFVDAWKLMTGRFSGSIFRKEGGVASTFANLPLANLNFSFQLRPAADASGLRDILQTMRRHAEACLYPSYGILCDDWLPAEWQRILAEEAFSLSISAKAMAAERLSPLRRPLPPQLEYRRVCDSRTARDLALVNGRAYAGYGMPAETWDCMGTMRLWHPDSFGYVGYVDNEAVSAAAVYPIEGALYIAWVATVPEAHGKGYGEAVLRRAIESAQLEINHRRLILHASVMGEPLYRSMGFLASDTFHLISADSVRLPDEDRNDHG